MQGFFSFLFVLLPNPNQKKNNNIPSIVSRISQSSLLTTFRSTSLYVMVSRQKCGTTAFTAFSVFCLAASTFWWYVCLTLCESSESCARCSAIRACSSFTFSKLFSSAAAAALAASLLTSVRALLAGGIFLCSQASPWLLCGGGVEGSWGGGPEVQQGGEGQGGVGSQAREYTHGTEQGLPGGPASDRGHARGVRGGGVEGSKVESLGGGGVVIFLGVCNVAPYHTTQEARSK